MKPGISTFIFFVICIVSTAQQNIQQQACIAFWNVENLYDTINDPAIDDEEFLPESKKTWNSERYYAKLHQLASVISKIGEGSATGMPAILGLAEVENKHVLEDLINQPELNKQKFSIIYHDGPDKRGVDVGLLYQPAFFKPAHTVTYQLHIENDSSFATREQLVVSGKFYNENIAVIVAHWPSRRGGAEESAFKRAAAADLGKHIIDSILQSDPAVKIIYMGDLNDNPNDNSVQNHLKAGKEHANTAQLYNPMLAIFESGKGTLEYNKEWFLFDQTILSSNWFTSSNTSITFAAAFIYSRPDLFEQEGKYKGTPFRTYAGTKYLGGFSDHLPVYFLVDVPAKKAGSKKCRKKKAGH